MRLDRRTFLRSLLAAAGAIPAARLLAACRVGGEDLEPVTRIGFGSCIRPDEHPMLDRTLTLPFELFILLGDNIYADTREPWKMAAKYRRRKESEFFQALLQKANVVATWDDHDYGEDGADADFPMKVESRELFLDFMDEPAGSPRRQREGVYDAYIFGPEGKRLQVILLDTRYFRKGTDGDERDRSEERSNGTMLGESQWEWLEEQLRDPADLRIIGSSIPFISENGSDTWAKMPGERIRLLRLLERTEANGVIFISGNRHWAELSKFDRPGDYPLYELTSSGLTERWHEGEENPFRIGSPFHNQNVGLITVDWHTRGPFWARRSAPEVLLEVVDEDGTRRIQEGFTLA